MEINSGTQHFEHGDAMEIHDRIILHGTITYNYIDLVIEACIDLTLRKFLMSTKIFFFLLYVLS